MNGRGAVDGRTTGTGAADGPSLCGSRRDGAGPLQAAAWRDNRSVSVRHVPNRTVGREEEKPRENRPR